MDFVVNEIFYLFWFSLTMGTFGDLMEPYPENQAVFDQATNVKITCVSNVNPNNIKWSFTPVGSTKVKIIKDGSSITDTDAFGGHVGVDETSYILFINTASSSTAGTYSCEEGVKKSVLLIVLKDHPSCDFTPKETNQVSCESTLQLSCTVRFIANTILVAPTVLWSTETSPDDIIEGAVESPSTSGNITTMISTLNVTWPKDEGDMPVYRCGTTFNLIMSTSLPMEMIKTPPDYNDLCQPFASPDSVPCIDKNGILRTAVPQTTTVTVSNDNPEAARSSSVRSAETNNLAIRVLGVAGVLLLAQMF